MVVGWSWSPVRVTYGLGPWRREVLALEHLALPPTGLWLIGGPPGAGKTTLLRWLWQRLEAGGAGARMVSERFAFPPGARVGQVLGVNGAQAWPQGLPRSTITEDQPVKTLSRGQRQLLGLAALDGTPAVPWLLDEPLAGLDAVQAVAVARWLQQQAAARLIVAVSHALEPFTAAEATLLMLEAGGRAYEGLLAEWTPMVEPVASTVQA
ncbi:MAG: ABC transporter ATP-binding protein [Puniceicoccaceae bacterium 5H]|nr:MAG: ABC transporter ATP-binding protein [Puniceicoccaceae bacterium 5H]